MFLDKNNVENVITEAIQTIEFEIDNKGGKLKSEALIAVKENAIMIEDPVDYRYFYCNDDFYMFLKEENKDKPYLALKVDDLKDLYTKFKLYKNEMCKETIKYYNTLFKYCIEKYVDN